MWFERIKSMTNKERWDSITDDLCSPQSYIDWSLRFMIAASLQRRVWYGPEHLQCFPNMYGILFGPPGIGKSLCIDLVSDILRTPKKKDVRIKQTHDNNTEAEKFVIQKTEDENAKLASDTMIKAKVGGSNDDPPLFISAPDAITYEALVETIGKSLRRINYNKLNPDGTSKLGIYTHCSAFFCLDELGSLFRKKTESVVNLLLTLHNCPKFYEYKTKNMGEDRIMNGCLNFLAGTTSDFMEEIAKDKLIGKGFTARCYYICANKKRKHVAAGKLLSPEQIQYKLDLVEHIKKLYPLYGPVKVDPSTAQWLEDWWAKTEDDRSARVNKSTRLDDYYPRKIIHVYKVAMMEHFLETTDMHMELWEFQKAIEILNEEEKTMHLALTVDNANPLSKVCQRVYDYLIKHGDANMADLIVEFWDQLPQGNKSMIEVLEHLTAMDKVTDVVEETGERKYKGVL